MAKVRRRRVGYGITNLDRANLAINAADLGFKIYSGIKDRQLDQSKFEKNSALNAQKIEESKAKVKGYGITDTRGRLENEKLRYANEYISIEPEDNADTARMYTNQGKNWTDKRVFSHVAGDIVMQGGKRMMRRGIYKKHANNLRADPVSNVRFATRKFNKSHFALQEFKKRNTPDLSDERAKGQFIQQEGNARQWSKERTEGYVNKLSRLQMQSKKNLNEAIGVARGLKGAPKQQLISNIANTLALRGMTIENYEQSVTKRVKSGIISPTDANLFIDNFNKSKLEIEKEEVNASVRSATIEKNLYDEKLNRFKGRGIKNKTPNYSEDDLRRIGTGDKLLKPAETSKELAAERSNERRIAGTKQKAQKSPYVKGKRVTFTGPDGSKYEGTYQGQGKDGEPEFTSIIKAKEKDNKATVAKGRRQWKKDSDGYLNKLTVQMLKDEVSYKKIRKFKEQVILAREKYINSEDYDTGTMKAIKEVLAKKPPKEKSLGLSLWGKVFGESENTEEPLTTPVTEPPTGSNQSWKKYQ